MLKIQIEGEDKMVMAVLDNTEIARDFASLLPLTVSLDDYAGTEKVVDLPRRLFIRGSPSGTEARTGDLTYYAPWGNLAIFLKNFRYSDGLVKLGKVEAGIDILRRPGRLKATLTLVSE